jgi:hypothetical protein
MNHRNFVDNKKSKLREICRTQILKNKMLSIKINLIRTAATLSLIKIVTFEFTNPNPTGERISEGKIKQNQLALKMGAGENQNPNKWKIALA